jgi:hypothetical protein
LNGKEKKKVTAPLVPQNPSFSLQAQGLWSSEILPKAFPNLNKLSCSELETGFQVVYPSRFGDPVAAKAPHLLPTSSINFLWKYDKKFG